MTEKQVNFKNNIFAGFTASIEKAYSRKARYEERGSEYIIKDDIIIKEKALNVEWNEKNFSELVSLFNFEYGSSKEEIKHFAEINNYKTLLSIC